jgi:hypothetical protein
LDNQSKRCTENNSSRDETAGYNRTDQKTNTEIAKVLNITPVLDKI